jgi:diguanylate cyclase (GGDEF)-like protein/PAS domain S-box-containing protein
VPFHPLLERQLRRARLQVVPDDPMQQGWIDLLNQIDQAYRDGDADAALSERANELASNEMRALQVALSAERDALESRVAERTRELRSSEQRTLRLLRMSADWFWESDANLRLTTLSAGFERVTGLSIAGALGRTPRQVWPDSNELAEDSELTRSGSARKPFVDFPLCVKHPDGREIELLVSGEPQFSETGEYLGYAGVAHNVTEERVAKREVEYLALHDVLTGLGNRRLFRNVLGAAISAKTPFVVTLIDLDKFKSVNDSKGHHAGDELLKEVARRLQSQLVADESVFRLSGDEFVVVSCGAIEPTLASVMARTLSSIRPHDAADPVSAMARASAGSAVFPNDATDIDGLLIAADIAMYAAKARGGNQHVRYSAALRDQWERRSTLAQAMAAAFETEAMSLVYQPIFDRGGKDLVGYEALLRWETCPITGFTPPDIIAFAEERGLITTFTQWCLRRLARDVDTLPISASCKFVSVNLTPMQISDDLSRGELQRLRDRIGKRGLQLVVELTESPTILSAETLAEKVTQIAATGISIALDDFGRGSSSLDRLLQLPIGRVKLDRYLVCGIDKDLRRQQLVSSVMSMANKLQLCVTAEGVETGSELEMLQSLGVDEMQGYLLGRPSAAGKQAVVHALT